MPFRSGLRRPHRCNEDAAVRFESRHVKKTTGEIGSVIMAARGDPVITDAARSDARLDLTKFGYDGHGVVWGPVH